jgi:hypothetical protein
LSSKSTRFIEKANFFGEKFRGLKGLRVEELKGLGVEKFSSLIFKRATSFNLQRAASPPAGGSQSQELKGLKV